MPGRLPGRRGMGGSGPWPRQTSPNLTQSRMGWGGTWPEARVRPACCSPFQGLGGPGVESGETPAGPAPPQLPGLPGLGRCVAAPGAASGHRAPGSPQAANFAHGTLQEGPRDAAGPDGAEQPAGGRGWDPELLVGRPRAPTLPGEVGSLGAAAAGRPGRSPGELVWIRTGRRRERPRWPGAGFQGALPFPGRSDDLSWGVGGGGP